jgi:hypothetical protein
MVRLKQADLCGEDKSQ